MSYRLPNLLPSSALFLLWHDWHSDCQLLASHLLPPRLIGITWSVITAIAPHFLQRGSSTRWFFDARRHAREL